MEEGILVPITMFVSFAVVMIVWLYLKHRSRVEMQHTFRMALEKGSELTPELIRQLGEPESDQNRDLRRGLIWLALSLGLVLIGVAVPEPEAFRGLLAGAALPFCIGAAYMVMYRLGTSRTS